MKTILGHKGQMIMPAVAHLGTVVEIIIVVQGGGGGDGRNVAPFEQGQLLLIKIQLDDHILQYVALNGQVNTRENAFLSSHERFVAGGRHPLGLLEQINRRKAYPLLSGGNGYIVQVVAQTLQARSSIHGQKHRSAYQALVIPKSLNMATIAAFVFLNIIEYPACNGHFRFHHHLIKLRRFRLQSDGYATGTRDRKSTRLNSSHVRISYAVFCLKKKKKYNIT